jgi:hypothetical protein
MTDTKYQTTPTTNHTPEPWNRDGRTTLYATPDESGAMTMIEVNANVTEAGWATVAFIEAIWPSAYANARRIVAAVNACKGIGTEALEQGVIRDLLEALEVLLSERLRPDRGFPFTERDVQRIQAAEKKARAVIANATGRAA